MMALDPLSERLALLLETVALEMIWSQRRNTSHFGVLKRTILA